MTRLAITVEGDTEEAFVKTTLARHLRKKGIEATPILIGRAAAANIGGGNVTIQRLSRDVAALYHSFDAVTTLVDYYGFRGKEDRTADALEAALLDRVRSLIRHGWDERKVLPYVQKHEFEGLLFADVSAFSAVGATPDALAQLAAARAAFPNPEEIDDHPATAPSKRIAGAISGYKKTADGPMVANRVGLETIRGQCPRFDSWLTQLESL